MPACSNYKTPLASFPGSLLKPGNEAIQTPGHYKNLDDIHMIELFSCGGKEVWTPMGI